MVKTPDYVHRKPPACAFYSHESANAPVLSNGSVSVVSELMIYQQEIKMRRTKSL